MATTFGTTQAQRARYGYERLVYTVGPLALANGLTNVFTAKNWNRKNGPLWQARLEGVAASQNAQVQWTYTADATNQHNTVNQGYTSALPSGLTFAPSHTAAVSEMSANLNNLSGAAIADWQTNYLVGMQRLNAAAKVLASQAGLHGYALTQAEWTALGQLGFAEQVNGAWRLQESQYSRYLGLIDKGSLPIALSRQIPGLWENRILARNTDLFAPAVSSADNPFVTYQAALTSATRGRFLVLEGIAIEGGPAVTVTIDRDDQLGYLQLNGAAFAEAIDQAWPMWVPAMDYLTVHVIQAPGSSATVAPIRITVGQYALSDELAVQFGRVETAEELTNPAVFYKTLAGIL